MDLRGGRRRKWWKKLATVADDRSSATATGRPEIFCDFLERRKRKGFGCFVVEARVDDLCYPLQNGRK